MTSSPDAAAKGRPPVDERAAWRRCARRLAALGSLTLLYFLAGRLGLSLAFVHASATAVWPPSGIALAAFLVAGNGVWPAILLAAFLVNVTTAGTLAASLGIALGNTLEGLLGAYLVNRFANGRRAFRQARDIFKFAVLAGLLSTTLSASLGLASLSLGGLAAWDGSIWLTWWLGDAVGMLVVAPVLVLWSLDRRWSWGWRRLLELLSLLTALALVSLFVFTRLFLERNYALQVLCVPMLLWAAFRFGPRESATSILGLSVIAIWGTLQGFGPFARGSANESLLTLQVFIGVWAVAVLAVSAVVAERRRGAEEVRRLNDELEGRVRERTEQLRTSEARLLEAQGLAHIGSWEWNIERDSLHWSDELYRLYGLDPGSFPASYSAFLERVHPDDRERVAAAVAKALEDRQPFSFEHRVVRPDRSERTLHARGSVIVDARGRPARMLGTGQDISERKRAEEERAQLIAEQAARREAEEANRHKDEFLAVLSHELRTPLNAIVGWGYVLKETVQGNADASRAIDTIGRNAQALARLIADLLDISRAISGRLALELRPTDVKAVIRSAVETIRPEADRKGLRVDLLLDATSAPIQADPQRLEQVVWNLLSNAVKFSPKDGRVRIRLAPAEGGQIEIRVDDEGPGIEPDFLPHIFERFRQADRSTTRRHGGLGLGLAIARNLVELLGGSVSARNREDAPGASFSIRLPAGRPSAAAAVASAGEAPAAAPVWHSWEGRLRGLRVLLIDDEPDGRQALVALLERCGADVVAAGSAAEGLSAVERCRPHVVLSDIQMPGRDGYAFLRDLRALPAERGGLTPAAALTAYAGSEERVKALRAGFQLHMAKPVDPAELVAALARLAGSRPDRSPSRSA